jgi:hypothetical protein
MYGYFFFILARYAIATELLILHRYSLLLEPLLFHNNLNITFISSVAMET